MKKLRVLDLFSGVGGFSLGLERTGGFETVAFCEIEPFPRKVLAKHWPDVPCFEDVRKLTRDDIDGPVDVICGGYPCQPFSTAGRRLGKEDDRHLWPEFARLVEEFRPTWVIGENVAGHISMGLDDVLSDLERLGYAARPFDIPAVAVDAKHKRARIWTVAHRQVVQRDGRGEHREQGQRQVPEFGNDGCAVVMAHSRHSRIYECRVNANAEEKRDIKGRMGGDGVSRGTQRKTMADTERGRRPEPWEPFFTSNPAPSREGKATELVNGGVRAKWRPEPSVGRVANGISGRVDRLKALGNAVVPQIPEMIGYAILEAERNAA